MLTRVELHIPLSFPLLEPIKVSLKNGCHQGYTAVSSGHTDFQSYRLK